MGWKEVYITGRSNFHSEVRKRLESSDIDFMPGYMGGTSDEHDPHDLYWVDHRTDLRSFKRAIGSKTIWKYRLRFFSTLESFIEAQRNKKKPIPEEDPVLMDFPDFLERR